MGTRSSFAVKVEYWRQYAWVNIPVALSYVCLGVTMLLAMTGLWLFGGETIEWLEVGKWNHATVFHEFRWLLPSEVQSWIVAPDDWFRLWKIVSNICSWPAWWVYLILAVPFIYLLIVLEKASATLSRRLAEDQ
jgi:hypothetical protein